MQKLYLKIALAIWTVMFLSAVAAVVVSSAIAPTEPNRPPRDFSPDRILPVLVELAVAEAVGSDERSLVASIQATFENKQIFEFVLRNDSGAVLAQSIPSAQKSRRDSKRPHDMRQFDIEHAGNGYELSVLANFRKGLGRHGNQVLQRSLFYLVFRSGYSWVVVVISAILSVAMSVGIARYLIRPLSLFERAGRKLSEGDFSVRIDPAIESRGDEIAEFASTFDRMAQRIEALVQSHKELLRDVSHELRSPLARAHAALSLARQRTDGVVDIELDRVELEFDRLNILIQKLLTYSRLDSGSKSLSKQTIDLNSLLRDVTEDCQLEAGADGKGVSLHEMANVMINGDAELLSSCFENLIRNGVQHSPTNASVDISLFEPDDRPGYCQIDIQDTGPGIPEADLQVIFEPFYRISGAGQGPFENSGIGLAIVKKAVAVHGGDVAAANVPGGGLLISVQLPLGH